MDATTRSLIEQLHHCPSKYVLAVTGGGTGAAALLLNVPGGSRTVLEVVVPYSEQALIDFLGRRPEHFCSAETAQAMARRAYERACWLAPGEAAAGVGCTASLVTDRPKRGDHRFHLAVHTRTHTTTHSLTLTKGARDREGEEAVLDAILLNALACAFGLPERVTVPLLPGEEVQVEAQPEAGLLAAFFRGEVPAVCVEADGRVLADAPRPAGVLPGSFNPVHEGHRRLAEVAAERLGGPVAFELSITNVDKPPLVPEEVGRRLHQFHWRAPLWLVRAPLFVEKADLFPGATFVVGADTAVRIVSPRYYQDSPARMAEALEHIRARGCRFLVAGRRDASGRFMELNDLPLPEAYRDLFAGISEEVFHIDISSTQLRQAGEAD